MRLFLRLAYLGTAYSGWQIQEKTNPPPTIQGELEKALAVIAGQFVRVFGAGRTDAGVHAHGQVAHCDVPDKKSPQAWQRSANALLPPDIRVVQAAMARPDFHARKDATSKTYSYLFWQERAFVPPWLAPYVWQCGPVDLHAMQAALLHLKGRHDYAGLVNAGSDVKSSVRTIINASLAASGQKINAKNGEFVKTDLVNGLDDKASPDSVTDRFNSEGASYFASLDINKNSYLAMPEMPPAFSPLAWYPGHLPMLELRITADGFLKQMVRNIAGLLVACGQGRLEPDAIPALLARHDRQALPFVTAPAAGLSLATVRYGEVIVPTDV